MSNKVNDQQFFELTGTAQYSKFIHVSRYSRWLESEGRRENWDETTKRYIDFFANRFPEHKKDIEPLQKYIQEFKVMPSMRCLMTAGKALERDEVAGYNCAFVSIDNQRAFDEILYILMCGTGAGFSVERQYVSKLPEVAEEFYDTDTTIVVSDSKIGWASAFRELVSLLYAGKVPKWDLSRLRPAGARLKTFGGRSSGPGPLDGLFRFTVALFKKAAGRRLNSLECHDLVCKVAEIVVVGGVRRCLPLNTFVHTYDGLKQIKDLCPIKDRVLTNKGRYRNIVAKESVGQKDVLTIKTQMGDFVCTPEHRMGVLSDLDGGVKWVEAANLKPGKHSLIFYKNILPGQKTYLPKWSYNKPKHSTTCKDIAIPDLDTEIAWFFGQLHGDGCVYKTNRKTSDANGYVSIACSDIYPEQHERVVSALDRFGCKVLAYNKLSEGCSKPRVSSHQLSEYLYQFKQSNCSIDIPEFIMMGTPDIRSAYVAGLFDADGAINNRPILVAASIYPDYLRQVQAVLSSLGIISYIKVNRKASGNWKKLYHLCLKGIDNIKSFANLVGKFSVKVKQDGMPFRKVENNSFVVPKSLISESIYKNSFTYNQVYKDSISWHNFENKVGKRDFVPISINDVVRGLKSVECYDIQVDEDECFVAEGLLTHNSALISLSNLSDDRMRLAKSGQWWVDNSQRRLSNNSACYTEKPELEIFMQEWLSLYESKSGERGIFNRTSAKKQAMKSGRRDIAYEFGSNPSLRKGTKVWTTNGVLPIDELENKDFYVKNLNGKISKAKCWLSGKNKALYKVCLQGGHEYYATAEHEWPIWNNESNSWEKVKTPSITLGSYLPIIKSNKLTDGQLGSYEDGFAIGWNLGDGWITERQDTGKIQIGFIVSDKDRKSNIHLKIQSWLKNNFNYSGSFEDKTEINCNNKGLRKKFAEMQVQHKSKGLPKSVWTNASEEFRKGLIDGLFSSDGCTSDRINITSANKKLLTDLSELLGFYGIKNTIKKANLNGNFPNGKDYGKIYTRYDLSISNQESIKHFANLFKLSHVEKQSGLMSLVKKTRSNTPNKIKVLSVEKTELKEDVWDISVADETHCFQIAHCITGNCNEIILRSAQFCNLSEVMVSSNDTFEDLKEKVKIATIFGTLQATLTNFRYLRKVWTNNTVEERLLGVSLSGIMDHKTLSNPDNAHLPRWLEELRQICIDTNKEWSKKLGIEQSASITAVKPSGTCSQLCNTSSGIHARYSQYYIRRVRIDKKDPLGTFMREIGFPCETDVMSSDNIVFSFPVKSPISSVKVDDITALKQLNLWKIYQDYWCEHKPSCTVYYTDDEFMDVGAWVWKHFDDISGISFLPYSDHIYKQAPYEKIDEETYKDLVSKMPKDFNWANLSEYEQEDNTAGSQTYACSGGSCEVVDLIKE